MDTLVACRYIDSVPGVQGGEPCIKGTRTPVRSIVEKWRLGYSPEEMVQALPHLKLSEVFEELSHFSDNQEEINAHIERYGIPPELLFNPDAR